jgi:hypothetical protein
MSTLFLEYLFYLYFNCMFPSKSLTLSYSPVIDALESYMKRAERALPRGSITALFMKNSMGPREGRRQKQWKVVLYPWSLTTAHVSLLGCFVQ